MNEFVLTCCSTADLPKERFEQLKVSYVCFNYTIDGVTYPDDLGQSIPFDEFYRRMAEGAMTSTSQGNMDQYLQFFEPFLAEGKDVLHVTLSSGISGSFNSACAAAQVLREKYPERKLYIVDSLGASSGYGLIIDKMAELRDSGMNIDALHDWVEEHKLNMHHWFFSTDLTYYVRGGRISKSAGFIGSILHICPLLNCDDLGRLTPRAKIRTKKRAINEIVQKMVENAENGLDYSEKCFICNSACYDDARAVADLVEATFPKLNGKVLITSIGTTIGSHTGPGTVALFFWGKKRVD